VLFRFVRLFGAIEFEPRPKKMRLVREDDITRPDGAAAPMAVQASQSAASQPSVLVDYFSSTLHLHAGPHCRQQPRCGEHVARFRLELTSHSFRSDSSKAPSRG
jgi:hypothetical protein